MKIIILGSVLLLSLSCASSRTEKTWQKEETKQSSQNSKAQQYTWSDYHLYRR